MYEEDPTTDEETLLEEARWQIAAQIEFERAEDGLDGDEYNSCLQRAIHYRGLDSENAELFLQSAVDVIDEVQIQFANSIADQINRAEMIVSDITGISDKEEIPSVEEVVRFINHQFPDLDAANKAVDDAAIKLAQVVVKIREGDF